MKKYNFYEDPGHGWLKIKITELEKLNIANKISGYSYMRGGWAYLEEDCDMGIFLDAIGFNGSNFMEWEKKYLTTHIADKTSKIREYSGFVNYTPIEKKKIQTLQQELLNAKNWGLKTINRIKNTSLSDLEFIKSRI